MMQLSQDDIERLGREFMKSVLADEPAPAATPKADEPQDTEDAHESRESLMADIIGGWQNRGSGESGDLSESLEAELLEGGFTGMITDKRGAKRYYENGRQVKGPGGASAAPKPKTAPSASFVGGPHEAATPKASTKRAASQAEAHAKIKTILAGNVTPEAHAELLGHLSTLTIPQLKALRDEHGLKASGKLKADLVNNIAGHFKQKMLATGSVDVPKLQDALKPFHDVELNQNDVNFAKANYETLKAQYGTLAIHRIEEIAKEHITELDDLPKGAKESRTNHEKKLAEAAWMLGKAQKDGITGEVEDPSMKDFGANLSRIQTAEKLKGVPWSNFLLRAVRDKFDIGGDTSDQQIWENLKDITGSKYGGERMDEALKMLRPDYGTMTQPQLRKILPLLKKPQDAITPEIAAKVAGKSVEQPAKPALKPAPNVAPPPKTEVKSKPVKNVAKAASLDSAHAMVQKLYDSALTDDKIFEKTDAAAATIGKELTVPQLKTLAGKLGINDTGKTKADILGGIARKIKGRREFHDRTKVHDENLK